MAQERNQEGSSEQPEQPQNQPPPQVLTLADRVRAALQRGLRAIIAQEVTSADAAFAQTERILVTTYAGFSPAEVPADLQMVRRDLHVGRDKYVEELTLKVTEDFRLAMTLVDWAIAEQEKGARPPRTPFAPHPRATSHTRSSMAQDGPRRRKPVPLASALESPRMPQGLTRREQIAVLQMIAQTGPVRTMLLRKRHKLEHKREHLKKFLQWCRKAELITAQGERNSMEMSPTEKLAAYLSDAEA